ncbi:hypothetical protein PPBDW_II0540 [Photobacterium kishitanii]|nr:hypothetical protein PPBDW_II0540 [Photobacterium kishitanii]
MLFVAESPKHNYWSALSISEYNNNKILVYKKTIFDYFNSNKKELIINPI